MLSLCITAGIGHPTEAGEIEDIYLYVAGEMAVEKVPAPPQVYFVDKSVSGGYSVHDTRDESLQTGAPIHSGILRGS